MSSASLTRPTIRDATENSSGRSSGDSRSSPIPSSLSQPLLRPRPRVRHLYEGADMKIFVAGASGALGQQLIPMLPDRGHQVVGMTRTPAKTALVRELGAEPVLADGLDATAVGAAVRAAEPEVVVHQMTALATIDMRHVDRSFAATNKLRTVGTDLLLAAARESGGRRFGGQRHRRCA